MQTAKLWLCNYIAKTAKGKGSTMKTITDKKIFFEPELLAQIKERFLSLIHISAPPALIRSPWKN